MPASLYHERQFSLLCGQHALNSLLQGPYFTAEDLTAIAVEFDEREKNLMREAGVDSADFLKYMAEDSGNAAADGNYSIQVLTRALETWNLKCIPALSPEAGNAWKDPSRERAFICNLDRHWLTLRRCEILDTKVHSESVGGSGWWNFNSTFPAPQPISDLYLAEFLRQLKDEGYGIFVCRGVLPEPKGPGNKRSDRSFATLKDVDAGDFGKWVTADEAAALNKVAETSKRALLARDAASRALARIGNDGSASFTVTNPAESRFAGAGAEADDADLRLAIEASLGIESAFDSNARSAQTAHHRPTYPDDDLARALAESLRGSKRTFGERWSSENEVFADDPDADLAAAIAASVAEETNRKDDSNGVRDDSKPHDASVVVPPEPDADAPGTLDIAVRSSGSRCRRRFLETDTVAILERWVGSVLGLDMSRHVLATSFPRKALDDRSSSIRDAGVRDKDALTVETRR
jgi:ataxin-3